jgi:hypothetical protein
MGTKSVVSPPSEQTIEYRNWLVAADQKASEAYDKAIMTLSGGALGLSLTFMKDIAQSPRSETIWRLELSWGCLAASLAFILLSMLSSQWALRKAIKQVDHGFPKGTRAGGGFSILTSLLNIFSGIAFVLGIGLLAWFTIANLSTPIRHP